MIRTRMAVGFAAALAIAHLAAVALLLDQPGAMLMANNVGNWAASLFGVAGTAVAARTFARGDYLRRVWVLLAAGAVMLLAGQAILTYWGHLSPGRPLTESALIYVRLPIIALANACSVWGMWLLAYSYSRSGLPVARTMAFNLVWLAVSAVAVALLVRQLRDDFGRFGSAPQAASALTSIASTIGDCITLILIAPVLRVAYLMRGGRLAGVWWAVGLSGFAWLLYDCRAWLAASSPGDPAHAMALLYVLRNPGLSLLGLGGFLQRDAVAAPAAAAEAPRPG